MSALENNLGFRIYKSKISTWMNECICFKENTFRQFECIN